MGREAKRIPLDFGWPLKKVWEGYLLPESLHEEECQKCAGSGLSPEAGALSETFYPHQIGSRYGRQHEERLAWHDKIGQAEVDNLLAEGRLRTWVPGENGERGHWESLPRTADEVNAAQRRGGLDGHDGINRHVLVKFRCERLGIPYLCSRCEGHGSVEKYDGQRAEAEAWGPTEPPIGDGWQMWETTSEGSPTSPVFATAQELAAWCAASGASVFGSHTAPADEWLRIITGEQMASVTIAPGVICI